MKVPPNLGQALVWVGWLTFLASLFLPMERHNVAGPCAWPCLYPFMYTVGNNSLVFVVSPFLLLLNLFSLPFDPAALKTVWLYLVYSAIGIGELLLLLAPCLVKSGTARWLRKSLLTALVISTAAVLLYALIPHLRIGIDALLIGYYVFLLSFLIVNGAVAMNFMMKKD